MTFSSSLPRGAGTPVSAAARAFGRFALKQLIGKSERSMLWLVHDPDGGRDLVLAMPRTQPADQVALAEWLAHARRAARLVHPHLAAVVEIDSCEHWPFMAYDRSVGVTLAEWLAAHPAPVPIDVARWVGQTLEALAYAHDAGLAHNDLQPHLLAISEQGHIRLLALGALELRGASAACSVALPTTQAALDESERLRHQREAAERDVLATGVLLHNLLAGAPALDEPDIGRTMARLPPLGRELLRLPRLIPHPVPEPLRAIVNRAVSGQVRQRYRSARTLVRALEGWRDAFEREGGGAEAMLLDRLHSVGHLPALPGAAERAARLALMERGRTGEMAEIVLQDIALSFELLRSVNVAHVHGAQVAGIGPVLTVRRAILMLGLSGVRNAALALRPWPGPLDEHAAAALRRLIDSVRLAGHVAQVIRPPGFDREVIFMVVLLQNLGRLLVQYHFADEAEQIRQLMRPVASERPGQPEHPGLTEETAAYAVLGADIESLGAAAARSWGMTDEVLHLIRRLPATAPVRQADRDDDVIRATASCANEAVDVLELPVPRQAAALEHVAHRYARALGISTRDLQDALQRAHDHGSDLMDLDDGGPPILSDVVTLPADLDRVPSASR
jgi:non-specific serine/threonine protein kinase